VLIKYNIFVDPGLFDDFGMEMHLFEYISINFDPTNPEPP
jgi:hypothetical protein